MKNMKMRKMITIALAGTITVALLAGCKKQTDAIETPVEEVVVTDNNAGSEVAAPQKEEINLGGWELFNGNSPAMMDEEDSTRIAVTLRGEGTDFDVLDLVATQVVSGVNYMYLVYGTTADNSTPGYYFVTIYENTSKDDSLTAITPINPVEIQTAEPLGKGATGAWAVKGSGKAGMLSDENAQASFDAINTGDVIYNPIALLATQLVSGTNYKAICRGSDENLYVVTWYNDLQGNASLTSAECVNIGAYSGN